MTGIGILFDGVLFLPCIGSDRKLNKPLLVTEKIGSYQGWEGTGWSRDWSSTYTDLCFLWEGQSLFPASKSTSGGRIGLSFPPGHSVQFSSQALPLFSLQRCLKQKPGSRGILNAEGKRVGSWSSMGLWVLGGSRLGMMELK